MLKKLITIFTLVILASCQSWYGEEVEKSGRSKGASDRINSSDENSKNVFKELDE